MTNRLKVRSEVRAYEGTGFGVHWKDAAPVVVEAHGVKGSYVVLTVEGKTVTVLGSDLAAAIKNAQNAS